MFKKIKRKLLSEKEQKILEAQDPNTSPERLAQLFDIYNFDICKALALNPNTPRRVLWEMCCDYYHWTTYRSTIIQRPDVSEDEIELWKRGGRKDCPLAEDPNTPPEELSHLAKSGDWRVRSRVARNPNTPVKDLEMLLRDPECSLDLAHNWSINEKIMMELAGRRDFCLMEGLLYNPSITTKVIKTIAKTKLDKENETQYIREKALKTLKKRELVLKSFLSD